MRGTKTLRGSDADCTWIDMFLLHIQDAGYKFVTAPLSSRPGVYKGAIDRKKLLTYEIKWIFLVFLLIIVDAVI